MRKVSLSLLAFLYGLVIAASPSDTVILKDMQTPILLEREDNALIYVRIEAGRWNQLDRMDISLSSDTRLDEIEHVALYYGGTEAPDRSADRTLFRPVSYLTSFTPGRTLGIIPSYSVLQSKISRPRTHDLSLTARSRFFPGVNYYWISVRMSSKADLHSKVALKIKDIRIDGQSVTFRQPQMIHHRTAVGVRHAGDDGVSAYRIPGLVTTKHGTLLAVYDVRHNNSVDLQEYIDVGVSRSMDGGRTWEKMRLPLSFGEESGLPASQNGVGDPCILYDPVRDKVWIAALWTQGMGNLRAWHQSRSGLTKDRTGQLMMVTSTDDGRTWSSAENYTRQVKDESWRLFLQGPGRGTTMSDGTLVFPSQFIDSLGMPHASIIYSRDGGKTWKSSQPARDDCTEAQVVELSPGELMLNMRDNRGGSRAVAVTRDMGMTWQEHPSSRKALPEPVCMASLLHVPAADNETGKDLLLFSNPNTTQGRHHITLKLSLDGGMTWKPEHQILLDEDESWGYSCLTMIDRETVGILYESSVAQMTFQAIKLKELISQ